jgi:hypothetical protein
MSQVKIEIKEVRNQITADLYKEGIEVKIEAGIFGKFIFFSGIEEVDEYDENGCYERQVTYGASTPVTRNGQYFLPWHISAALGSSGHINSWIKGKKVEEIVAELVKIHSFYKSSNWFNAVKYANQITGESVY